MLSPYAKIRGIPFRGGAVTSVDKALLPLGGFSAKQNLRDAHPGFKQRKGQIKLHSTADSTNQVVSLYQWNKSRVSETHFYAQMGDGDVLEATNGPPTVTTGVFGSEVFSGSSGQVPASWGNIDEKLIFSNGADQHQIYGGTGSYVDGFIVYKGSAAIPDVPQVGEDYSKEVSDGTSTTVAVLDSLNTYANHNCLFIFTTIPAVSFTFTVGKANGTASTASIYYRKSDNTWAAASGFSDGTSSDSKSLAQTGTMSFTAPSDMIPKYAFGQSGYWYQVRFSAQIDSEVEVSSVTYNTAWADLENVWDGLPVYGVEVQVEGTSTYSTYGAAAVTLDALASGKKIVVGFTDPVEAIYIDCGATPNATGTTLTSLKYWTGSAFASVGTVTDGTSGMSSPGWLTFPRKAAQPHQFGTSVYAYWYEIIWDSELAATMEVGIQGMPYFDIADFGAVGTCNCTWKDRSVVSFDRYGDYIYISEQGSPQILNGSDYGILRAGDGRRNEVVAMRRFHNELVVFQEEKGVEGGCVTLFQGYSPTTWGKLIISSRIGTFSNKSVAVVEGVLTATATDETVKNLIFFLSRYGVCVTDGKTISIVSDDIQNYFDPTKSECIRRGYEKEHFLEYDSGTGCLLLGLVSGASATKPNVFPVFDLTDKAWSFDSRAQELSCIANVEAQSGNVPHVTVGGGTDDGTVYLINSGTNDVSTAIDAYATMELNADGDYLQTREMILRCKAQAAGNITVGISANGISKGTKTLSMVAEVISQTIRRHRTPMNVADQNVSIKMQNATASQELELHDIGFDVATYEER